MTWRLFMVLAAFMVATLANGWMSFKERLPTVAEKAEVKQTVKRDRLKTRIRFTRKKRFDNLKKFGFSEDDADKAYKYADRLAKDTARFKRLEKLIEDAKKGASDGLAKMEYELGGDIYFLKEK